MEEPEMSSGRIALLPKLGVKAMKLFIKTLQNQDGRAPDSSAGPWGVGAIRAGVLGREGSVGCEGIGVFIWLLPVTLFYLYVLKSGLAR